MDDQEGTVRYYIVAGLIIDGYPPIKNSVAVTLVYDNVQDLENDWPEAHYVELVGTEKDTIDA